MASRASVPPASFGSSSRKPSSSTPCRNATTSGCGRITSATSSSASPISDVTLPGADSVSVSAAFFSPSHSCSWSLSHQVASIPAMIACMFSGSLRTRLCSSKASSRKSNSAGPVIVAMSRRRAAMDAWLRSISSVTMAGSVSIGADAPPAGGPPGPASGSDGMKSPRSRTVSSASLISGSASPHDVQEAGAARRRGQAAG